jgi:two-component system, chemotaxis family, protein-glutamate methylesterase/glutaminase
MGKIRVVIADDSSMARGLLREILGNERDIEVIGEACDGRRAVELARELKPDLMTIDLEMPLMSGLEAIDEIMHTKAVPILVVSSVADAQNALAAVGCGALEVVAKPDYTPQASTDFVAKVRLLAGVSVITRMRARKAPPLAVAGNVPAVPPAPTLTAAQPAATQSAVVGDYARVFAIASSTGGPQALAEILPLLPRDFPCPVLIAQHIADGFAGGMAEWLASLCKLPVRLAVAGEPLQPGVVLVSPSERHLTITPARRVALLECGAADIYHPNCDLLLNSVADVFGRRAVGIILTGMGSDGAKGIARIAEKGGTTLGQDEASSVIYGMNRVAIESGVVHQVLPMGAVAGTMIGLADPFRLPGMAGAGVAA